jgi:hypothetical protein
LRAPLAALALPWLLAAVAHAEPLYVVEQLVVAVNAAADGSGERIATVKSGDKLELLERAGESVHVRLPDGRDGWLRAMYLSGDPPLRPRLAQSEAEVARLRAEVARLSAAPAPAPRSAPATAAAVAVEEPAPLFGAPAPRGPLGWAWPLAAGIAGAVLGFLVGWRTLDRRIRARYGGLRIY